jgi:hypothetical protein
MLPRSAHKSSVIAVVLLACFLVAPYTADGAVILAPVSASTTMGEFFPASNAINQSGLSIGYVSLTTDFNDYIAAQPTALHGSANVWAAPLKVQSGKFDLALGGTYRVSGLALWNPRINDPSSLRQFNVSLSSDASFSTSETYSGFVASNSLGTPAGAGVQSFYFPTTVASFVRLNILNSWSSTSFSVGINEVALRVSPIPEPTTLISLGVAAMLVGNCIRPRRRS